MRQNVPPRNTKTFMDNRGLMSSTPLTFCTCMRYALLVFLVLQAGYFGCKEYVGNTRAYVLELIAFGKKDPQESHRARICLICDKLKKFLLGAVVSGV